MSTNPPSITTLSLGLSSKGFPIIILRTLEDLRGFTDEEIETALSAIPIEEEVMDLTDLDLSRTWRFER